MVARMVHSHEAVGSSPTPARKKRLIFYQEEYSMENTDKNPATVTSTVNDGKNPSTPEANGGQTANTQTETKSADNPSQPFKTFATQEEFDKHSAGILSSAQKKAEKELLALLGLKPDEKDKLAKFKEAYESTLTDAEKKKKELDTLTAEAGALKAAVAEKDAIIAAITKSTGKKAEDVVKFVKMAKGLVDENTTMEQALETVLSMATAREPQRTVPQGTPPAEPSSTPTGDNPFKTGNLTEQGKIFKENPEKARMLYKEATGKNAPF